MIDVYAFFRKVPGGMLLIPMFIVAIINTIFPNVLAASGSMTSALFKGGTLAFAALILFATGAAINVKSLGETLKRCGSLTIAKLVISFGAGYAFMMLFGMEGLWGVSSIAFVVCICSCNPGVYMGLIQDFGEPADLGNFALLNVLAAPAIPLLIITTSGGVGFDTMEVITVFIPLCLGMLLGNLDPKLAKMFGMATPICLPFLGCCFGASLNLVTAVKAGVAGIILSVIYLIINCLVVLFTDRFINKRPGYAGIASCSVAGISLVVPIMLGGAYEAYRAEAIAQIALCLIITSIVSPFITKAVVKKWGAPRTLHMAMAGGGTGPGKPAAAAPTVNKA